MFAKSITKAIVAKPMMGTLWRSAYLLLLAFMIASYTASAMHAPAPHPVAQPVSYSVWT